MRPEITSPSTIASIRRRSALAAVTAASLLAVGCTSQDPVPDADQDAAASSTAPSPTEDASDEPASTPSPTDTTDGDGSSPLAVEVPELDTRCVLEPEAPGIDRIEYAVPSSWQDEERCDLLAPDLELPDESMGVDVAVSVDVLDVPFSEVAEPSPATEDVTRYVGARGGFAAYRETALGTGEAMTDAGAPGTTWVVDLGADTESGGSVLTLSTGHDASDDHALASTVLDLIAGTVVVQAAGVGQAEGGVVVTRTQGGGTPYTVTYDGDCFALRPGGPTDEASDELCDLDPAAGQIVAGTLGDDVLVGYAPPTTVALALPSGQPPFGLATGIEGSAVFGFRVDGTVGDVTALAAGGAPIVTSSVG